MGVCVCVCVCVCMGICMSVSGWGKKETEVPSGEYCKNKNSFKAH